MAVGRAAIPAALIGVGFGVSVGVLSARLLAGAALAVLVARLGGVALGAAMPAFLVVLVLLVATRRRARPPRSVAG